MELLELAARIESYDPKQSPDNRADELELHRDIVLATGEGGMNPAIEVTFVRSLDAALSLVPEGVRETHIVSFASDEGPLGAAWIEGAAYFERGDAKTPTLALVAAALRARAADTPSVKP